MRPGRNVKIDAETIDLIFNKEKAGTLHFIKNVPALPYCIGITRIIICMIGKAKAIPISNNNYQSHIYLSIALFIYPQIKNIRLALPVSY